jgi:hypothetical protein
MSSNSGMYQNPDMPVSVKALLDVGVSEELLKNPIYIEQLYIMGGVNKVSNDRRSFSHSFNNGTFQGNINIQGDDVRQTNTNTTGVSEDAFLAILEQINMIQDEYEKRDALHDYNQLQEAVKTEKWQLAKRYFFKLPEFIRTSASAITIAKAFGWLHDISS